MNRTALPIWFLAAAVLLAANSAVSYFNVQRLHANSALVSAARDTIFAADRLLATLLEAERAQRGFIITGAKVDADAFAAAARNVRGQMTALEDRVADRPHDRQHIERLRGLVTDRLDELQQSMEASRTGGFEAGRDMLAKLRERGSLQPARDAVESVRNAEQDVLALRSAERDASATTARVTVVGAAAFNLLLLAAIARAVARDRAARARITDAQRLKLELERDNARLAADVEERARVNDTLTVLTTRLEQSNRQLEDFASVASHDLQEPLRKIQAFGDRLRTKFAAPLGPDGRDYVDRMHAAAARMQTLINDLLGFSRVTTKGQPFVPVDLGVIVTDVLSDLEARVESSGGTVDVGPLPTIDADPVQMRQLFQNLIANALKFRRPEVPPVVTVSSSMPTEVGTPVSGANGDVAHGKVEIRIADNGIGFDEKYLDRIFNVFQRLHGRGEYEGTGIGLAVCRKIVERHGGSVTATSRPGEGATFVITLPVIQPGRPGGEPTDADDAQVDHHPAGR